MFSYVLRAVGSAGENRAANLAAPFPACSQDCPRLTTWALAFMAGTPSFAAEAIAQQNLISWRTFVFFAVIRGGIFVLDRLDIFYS